MKSTQQQLRELPDQTEVELHVTDFAGKKIEAVKVARTSVPGLGLAEAKAFIEGTYNLKINSLQAYCLVGNLENMGCSLQACVQLPEGGCVASCDCATPEPKKPDLLDLFEGGVRTALGYAETLCPSKADYHRRSLFRVFVAGGRKAVEEYLQEEKSSVSQHQEIVEQLQKAHIL